MFKKGFSTILIVIIVLVVIAGGVLAWQYWPESVEQEPTADDETADWQTYRNEKYGFEVKYTGNLIPSERVINISTQEEPFELFSLSFNFNSNRVFLFRETSHQYLFEGHPHIILDEETGENITKEVIVSGVEGLNFRESNEKGGPPSYFSITAIKKDNKVYEFWGEGEVFNQMLSTFRFIDIDENIQVAQDECDNEWGSPVNSEKTGSNWDSIITSIYSSSKVINSEIGYKVVSAISDSTIIKNETGKALGLNDLHVGDYIFVSGWYQMRNKYSDKCDWEVKFNTVDGVTLLGKCTAEGQPRDNPCCTGLTLVDKGQYCTQCGNLLCKYPENEENCPLDCVSENDITTFTVDNLSNFDFTEQSFEMVVRPGDITGKVLVSDSTKFYSVAVSEERILDYFTFLELSEKTFLHWLSVKGELVSRNPVMIRADEVFHYVQ